MLLKIKHKFQSICSLIKHRLNSLFEKAPRKITRFASSIFSKLQLNQHPFKKRIRKFTKKLRKKSKKFLRKKSRKIWKYFSEIKLHNDWALYASLFIVIFVTIEQIAFVSISHISRAEMNDTSHYKGIEIPVSQSGQPTNGDPSSDETTQEETPQPPQSFSNTVELQKVLEEKYAEREIGIYVVDLTDRSKTVSVNAQRQFITASTYKMFAAYSMYKSHNVPECISVMIIQSDNACPINYMQGADGHSGYGWVQMMKDVQELGLKNTKTTTEANFSTAEDEALFLTLFYDGKLSPPMDKDYVLELMESQVHRRGIPAGVKDRGDVADKVGMINALVHDAAIVFSPAGDYVEVVMTDNESWERVAEIADIVEEYMHPQTSPEIN